jgi:hypothetical protein
MHKSDRDLVATLSLIKEDYEKAIRSEGTEAAHSLIRSQKLIGHLHEYIKKEFVKYGVDPAKIYPPLGRSSPELKMVGFLKSKDQDICILPSSPKSETVKDGVLVGEVDPIGKEIMNEAISINLRSQLSSLGKNFDTLYERTFAEALNLHMRAPKLVMGEIYMIPYVGYDADAINKKEVAWKEHLPTKYVPAFKELNNREKSDADAHKYERVCLLVVDFRENPPEVLDFIKNFSEDQSLPGVPNGVPLSGLTMSNFVPDLLRIYNKRHSTLGRKCSLKIYSKEAQTRLQTS